MFYRFLLKRSDFVGNLHWRGLEGNDVKKENEKIQVL